MWHLRRKTSPSLRKIFTEHLLSVLGSPCLQGELDFVAASRQQKTERIFVRLAVGILTTFICRHQCIKKSSQSRRFNP